MTAIETVEVACVACLFDKKKSASENPRACFGQWFAYRYDPNGEPVEVGEHEDDSVLRRSDFARIPGGPSSVLTRFVCTTAVDEARS